jgi:photosystem II stability/assembly factor-like uncharacterized protein
MISIHSARYRVAAVLCAMLFSLPCVAHTPHDDIFDVRVSPSYADHQRVYTIVRSIFQISDDGGQTWARRVNGLNHASMLVSFDIAANGQTIYLASLGDGVFRSDDRGDTWRAINDGLTSRIIDVIAVSPEQATLVLASDTEGRLYRTVDGAEWTVVDGEFGKPTTIAFDGSRVFLGDHTGQVLKSRDDGARWEQWVHIDGGSAASALYVMGTGSDTTLWIGTDDGRVLSIDAVGEILTEAQVAHETIVSIDAAPSQTGQHALFASAWHEGIFHSHDSGASWVAVERGLTRDRQAQHLGRPSFSRLSVSPDFARDRTVFAAGFDGLFKTVDAGQSWSELTTLSMENIIGVSFSPDFADDQTMALVTWVWGPYLSPDAGRSWRPMLRGLREPYLRAQGLVRTFRVEFSPAFATDGTLFTSTWYDFFKSNDAGRRWRALPPFRDGDDGALDNDGSYLAISPDFAQDGTVFIGTKTGHVLRSTNHAASMEVVHDVASMIGSVVVSPNFATDGTVFVGDLLGIHTSVDRGQSWQYTQLVDERLVYDMPISAGYPAEWRDAWQRHILDQRKKEYAVKVAVSPTFAEDRTVFAGLPHGLTRSDDGGHTWQAITAAPFDEDVYVEAVAVAPNFASELKLAVSLRGRGLFLSDDAGGSFRPAGRDLTDRHISLAHYHGMTPKYPAVMFSPDFAQDQTIYGFAGTELFASTDAGETWQALPTPGVSLATRGYARWLHVNHTYRPFTARKLTAAGVAFGIAVFGLFAIRRLLRARYGERSAEA